MTDAMPDDWRDRKSTRLYAALPGPNFVAWKDHNSSDAIGGNINPIDAIKVPHCGRYGTTSTLVNRHGNN